MSPYFIRDMHRQRIFTVFVLTVILAIRSIHFAFKSPSSVGRHVALHHKRIAYVVSTNATSTRYKNTEMTLQNFGFDVWHVVPQSLGTEHHNKVRSNKLALLKAFGMIAEGAAPWGYIFEDDIRKHELSTETFEDLLQAELTSELFLYLGICTFQRILPVRCCGRCSHAMGASRAGAKEILEFSRLSTNVSKRTHLNNNLSRVTRIVPSTTSYLDDIIEAWCWNLGGFALFGPRAASSHGHFSHFGIFIQDRTQFPSLID